MKGLKVYILEVKRRLAYMLNNRYDLREKQVNFYVPKYKNQLTKNLDKMKKLQVYLIVALLILLPVWHFSISRGVHNQAHIKVIGGGFAPGRIDPVKWEIKPTYDTDHAFEKMQEKSDVFRPDLIERVIDLDKLTDVPGRIAVYRFSSAGDLGKILLVYTYVSPVPVVKAVGIQWVESTDQLFVKNVKTFVFPIDPITISSTADV